MEILRHMEEKAASQPNSSGVERSPLSPTDPERMEANHPAVSPEGWFGRVVRKPIRRKLAALGLTASIALGTASCDNGPEVDASSKKNPNPPATSETTQPVEPVPTTVTVTTEPPTTTTTEVPEVLRTEEGKFLQQFGYDIPTIQKIVDTIKQKQEAFKTLNTSPPMQELVLVDNIYHPEGAEAVNNYVDSIVNSGREIILNIPGVGEATYKIEPISIDSQKVIVLPLNGSVPVPPSWKDRFNGKKSSYGLTSPDGMAGFSVIGLDTERSDYDGNYLAIQEGLMRKRKLSIVSRDGVPAEIDSRKLETIAREVYWGYLSLIGGMKMSDYPLRQITDFVNGTDGKGGNFVDVTAGRFEIPKFNMADYIASPDSSAKVFGAYKS